jgi:hypothetical protein
VYISLAHLSEVHPDLVQAHITLTIAIITIICGLQTLRIDIVALILHRPRSAALPPVASVLRT